MASLDEPQMLADGSADVGCQVDAEVVECGREHVDDDPAGVLGEQDLAFLNAGVDLTICASLARSSMSRWHSTTNGGG